MNCKYCNKLITCGCQKAVAKDGSTVHKACLSKYDNTISKNTYSNTDSLTQTVNRAVQNLK